MKIRFWDVLSILGLIGICIQAAIFGVIFTTPDSFLNPFPPANLPAAVHIPTTTATHAQLPPTWTHTPAPHGIETATLAPSQTLPPTATGFQLPTFTSTPTHTFTPSNTPTPSDTPTITETYTLTNTYTPSITDTPTATATE